MTDFPEAGFARIKFAAAMAIGLALALSALPVSAEILVLEGGGFLKISEFEVIGSRVRVSLTSGGTLYLSLTRVERIVEDELEPIVELVEPGKGGSFRLEHRLEDTAPDVPFGDLMLQAAARHGLNPQLIAAMARVESSFRSQVVSPKGARGLMQVMPATGIRFGAKPSALFDPETNIETGVRYIAWLKDRFSGSLDLILAAYNAGEATVDRYQGVPPYRETRDYIERIRSYLEIDPEPS